MTQDFVVRVFFKKATDAETMQGSLYESGFDSDYVEADKSEPGAFKLIFTADSVDTAAKALRESCYLNEKSETPRWAPRPTHYDIFNPVDVESGFTKFSV
jgi:hypothetical protein